MLVCVLGMNLHSHRSSVHASIPWSALQIANDWKKQKSSQSMRSVQCISTHTHLLHLHPIPSKLQHHCLPFKCRRKFFEKSLLSVHYWSMHQFVTFSLVFLVLCTSSFAQNTGATVAWANSECDANSEWLCAEFVARSLAAGSFMGGMVGRMHSIDI